MADPNEVGAGGAPGEGGEGRAPGQPTISIEQEMRNSYVDYAMSVIVGRALPDVRDGLKPVHRRVLFTQHMMKNNWNSAYKKSARIVGDCIGKYHPHGDAAVYDTLVRMAQTFSMRAPLVDGQGNFGSVDGDPPAAMRYTEVRMTRLAHELLADIDKETVDFQPNYDGHDEEPTVLPSRVPNLLVNGTSGIAVGMATNIPPHNLGEVIDALIALIDDPTMDLSALMKHIRGPDFPTAGLILGRAGIWDAYATGRGRIRVRARTHIEVAEKGNRETIVVDELPYQVNKAKLLEHIAQLVRDKRIEGISDLRDESDRTGIRMVIECKRDAQADIVLNHLYRATALQTTFGVINLAIVAGEPRVLTLRELLDHFLDHRREVVTRRCLFELAQARARAHILEGLLIALDHLDEVIELIRRSPDTAVAKAALCERFAFSDLQAQAILDMRLGRLTGLERDKIRAEFDELQRQIAWLTQVLESDALLLGVIKGELTAIRTDYADGRRTEILDVEGELTVEDLIADEDVVVTLTNDGYIKRTLVTEYRAQRRGGRGTTGMATKEDDVVSDLFVASAHMPILFFTSHGRAFSKKTYELPQGSRTTRGKPIVNLLPVEKGEEIKAVLPVRTFDDPDAYVLLATRDGRVKKTELEAYANIRASGIIGIVLEDGDDLIDARLVRDDSTVLLATRHGMAIHFRSDYDKESGSGLRPMGRATRGVTGIRMREGDAVVSLAVLDAAARRASVAELAESAEDEGDAAEPEAAVDGAVAASASAVGDEAAGTEGAAGESDATDLPEWVTLTISENGFGKLTDPAEYRLQGRGGLGIIDLKTRDKGKPTKTGAVVGLRVVRSDTELLLVTDGGKLIRTRTAEVRLVGRNAMGVKVINLEAGERVVGFDVLAESAIAGEDAAEGDGDSDAPVRSEEV